MSLHSFLVRLIWLCVLPLILLAAYLAIDSVRDAQSARDLEAANLAKNFATAVDHELSARIGALHMLAVSPLADDASRRKDLYQEAQGFRESFGSHVILADLEMQMLFNTRVPFGATLPMLPRPKGHAAAPTAVETGAPAVGDIFFGPVAKEALVAIAVPGKRGGKTAFLLLTIFEIGQFQKRLDQVALPAGWSLALLDGTGEAIARRAPPGLNSATDVGAAGRFVAKSALSPWSVTIEIPRDIYRAPLFAAAIALALLILGATLAGVLGGRLAGRRLAKSVASLAQAPASGAPPSDITEIATARRLLDEAAEKRATAEVALRESEQRFKLAAATGNVWDWNILTNETSFPLEFWLGLGYEERDIGNPAAMLESALHPEDRARWRQAIKDHISRRLPYDLDYRARAKSGEYRWFNTKGQARWDANGHATYMAGTAFDITERKRAEEALQKLNDELEQRVIERTAELETAKQRAEVADRLKSAFLATMSHELRTPLNSIIGFTGIILQGLAGPLNPEQAKQLGMVQDSARHLLALINDVLDISKIEAGELTVSCEPFDLRASITKVAGIVKLLAEKKDLALRVELAPGVGQAVSDSRRVEQILLNLLNNAIKFTERGEVVLSATCEQDGARLTNHESRITFRVADTGMGIKPEDLATLFQPFRQIDSGLARNHEGTGLGLAICRRLADLMGGEIHAESEWGKGSTFSFTLPLKGPVKS